jgi:hypothetical protein
VLIRATIRSYVGKAKRAYRALRTRLRSARAAVALLVLLTLSLGEPLLCIIHCQVWLPIAYHSYFAAQHTHMHHEHMQHGSSHTMAAEPADVGGTIGAAPLPASDTNCFMQRATGAGDSTPFHVPPSPVHDLLPALVVLLSLVWLSSARPAAPPGDPPRISHPPQLRPPIPFAA